MNRRSKSRKEMYKDIYKVTYIANITKMIEETRYIDVLQKLSMNGFKTYHIDDFDKLTVHLKTVGLTDSFNISLLIYLRDTNYKKLSDIAVLFDYVGTIFSNKRISMVTRISSMKKIFKKKLVVVRSFKKIEKISSFKRNNNLHTFGDLDVDIRMISVDDILKTHNTLISDQSIGPFQRGNTNNDISDYNKCITKYKTKKMTKMQIESEWKHYTRDDILNRLHLLAQKHFTINQLIFMDVEIKHIIDIENMLHNELEKYYINVVSAIESSLKNWMTLCRMYIDIEVNYTECCRNIINGKATKLNLKHFKINICETNIINKNKKS